MIWNKDKEKFIFAKGFYNRKYNCKCNYDIYKITVDSKTGIIKDDYTFNKNVKFTDVYDIKNVPEWN